MSRTSRAGFVLVVLGAIGMGAGSRSFVFAQQAVAPAQPNVAVARMLDQVAAEGAAKSAGMTGTITAASGSVKVRRVKALFWENAQAGQEVAEGDHIQTGKDGQVKITLDDGNSLFIKKNSVVIIEALSRDEKTGRVDAAFKTTKARLKAQIDNKESLNSFEIRTPVVVCGVRGTVLYVNAGPGFADVFVERGSVFLRSPVSGQERDLPPGMATKADRSGNIAEPEPPPPGQLAEMQGGWEPPPLPPKEGRKEGTRPPPPPIVLADTLPPPPAPNTTQERKETQESAKTDYINNPPPPVGDNDLDGIADNVDPDDDNDYLSDLDEMYYGTGILKRDTDLDGLTDWEEVRIQGTDPLDINSDGDSADDLNDMAPTLAAESESRANMRTMRYEHIAAVAGLRAEITTMLADAQERQKDYIMDRISDAQLHKVMRDSNGMWTRLEQYVLRPAPNKIVVSALSYRSSSQLTAMHLEMDFNIPLTGLSSQQIKNLPWGTYLAAMPDYGAAAAPSLYPTAAEVEFERYGTPATLLETRVYSSPNFLSTTFTQTVTRSVSISGSAMATPYNLMSGTGNPAWFSFDVNAGTATTVTYHVHVIDDAGNETTATPYDVFSFSSIWDVLGAGYPGHPDTGPYTLEIIVGFPAQDWSYLYLPLKRLTWRGTPQWEEQLTW